jgi:YesN/AraC family two-component response regulator
LKKNQNLELTELKMKCKSFHIVSGISIMGIDFNFHVHYSYENPTNKFENENRNLLIELLSTLKEKSDEILKSYHSYFKFYITDKWLYHVYLLKNGFDPFMVIVGPIKEGSTEFTEMSNEKFDHFLQLFQWIIQPYCPVELSKPILYKVANHHYIPLNPDVSLVDIYYESESFHGSVDEFEFIKSMMLEGKITEVENYIDSNIKFIHQVDQIELAKGDSLRSAKNHLISACSILSQVAIDGGANNEYTRTLADKYIFLIENLTSKLEIYVLMKEMILKFTECIIQFSNPNYSNITKRVIQYLHTNFYEKITLEEVAKKFNISPTHLSKKLKKETEMSFNHNLNKIRVNESKRLLLHTDKSILDVAIAVGFNYQNHFGKVFKQMVGVSPNVFRNKLHISKK